MVENELINTQETLPVVVNQDVEQAPLIPAEKITNYYEEAIQNLREDRDEADQKFHIVFDKIINEGDATSASKELVSNLLKIKVETTNSMIKILDLWTRIHLKEQNTMPEWMKAKQNVKNQQINIHADAKSLIDLMDKNIGN